MARLEDLTRGATVKGVLPDGNVTVVDVKWHGSAVVELTYKDAAGRLGGELLYRDREPELEVVTSGRPWGFEGDGALFKLASEAYRIQLAYLFDPLLAIHTSLVEPLPHQITAVYGEMLLRQPLRFLLADDPGSGKTIMAGLLIKELLARGDVQRCLICAPGNLVEQWQDEMAEKFHLPFEIITRDKIESSRTGNPFAEYNLVIGRLDQLSRDEDLQSKLRATDWDLIICDEAHKMSASFFSGEVKETKRYKLGRLFSSLTRHFLLMTATPHNGKEEDFQLFMALLDGDRFEGRFRNGVHVTDTSDLMRRLVKEQLLKFDGKRLFPERRAYSVNYKLSDQEAALYEAVTNYVREEMNRADRLAQEGDTHRRTVVGFALTILQRRLASSPEAIYQSLRRRRERLEKRLREEKLLKRGLEASINLSPELAGLGEETFEDLEDAPESEAEATEEKLVDEATAARTIAELEVEISELHRLENMALKVRQSGKDRKWEELADLMDNQAEMFDPHGSRRKLVIFTEHRDTLNYLADRLRTRLGNQEAVAVIHGGMVREQRRKAQEAFTQDKDVLILVATDAAGEGINLQRAHLMVNYDLPWNPNRIEQRFGRIHRIGQTEVCHLWNMVAFETREGEVFHRLFTKLEEERKALGGQVFDVLGKVFEDRPLRELLVEAIRYGDQPEVKARLHRVVDHTLDRERLRQLIEEKALAHDTMDWGQIQKIKAEMERAEARRLQPHFISAFFLEAFRRLGGSVQEREPKRYEITNVPAVVRNRDRVIGRNIPILAHYERICFEKELIRVDGKPMAEFVCPGHPLLDAVIDLILERYRDLLKTGTVLVDPADDGQEIKALFYLENSIQDARTDLKGNRHLISRQLQFVELNGQGEVRFAGYAPYLDYDPLNPDEMALVRPYLEEEWLKNKTEEKVLTYAVQEIVPRHLSEVRDRREELIRKTMAAVKDRLTKEINYWDHRAEELKMQELAGKANARINSGLARQRADELAARLQKRMEELEQERRISALPPVIVGGAMVVPAGLLKKLKGEQAADEDAFARETREIEKAAMQAVMEAEKRYGREPRDVSAQKWGYDIESQDPQSGKLYFLEVKGRKEGAATVTVTKNEILTAMNKPEEFFLVVVEVKTGDNGVTPSTPVYIHQPFQREPDFGVTSVNYQLAELLARAERAS